MGEQLLTAREWRGVWWHPSARERVVAGILSFTPGDGPRLSVIGVLDDPGSRMAFQGVFPGDLDDATSWHVLHGVDEDGHRITLCDVQLVKSKGTQVVSQELSASRALVGCHLEHLAQPVFGEMTAAVEGLSEFVGLAQDSSGNPGEEVEFRLGADLCGRLWVRKGFRGRRSFTGSSDNQRTETVFAVDSQRPRSAEELITLATTVEALVSMAYQSPMRLYALRLHLATDRGEAEARIGSTSVDVFQGASATHVGDRRRPRLLFKCDAVPADQVVIRWLSLMEEYRGACQMLLTLIYEDAEFINPRVVTAVTAAEAMQSALVTHKVLAEVTVMPEEEHKALRAAAVSTVPKRDAKRIKSLFRGNRAGLAGRLENLARGDDGQPLGGLLPDPKAWAVCAARARNGIAHGSTGRDVSPERLFAVVETSRAVVTLRLLERLGFTENDLRETVTQSRDLLWVTRLAAEQFPSGDVQ